LFRAFNRNQILILSLVERNVSQSLSSLLKEVSNFSGIPLSTLKYNARVLRELGVISYGSNSKFQIARLTDLGKFISELLKVGECQKIVKE
jgi:hypothetical protein